MKHWRWTDWGTMIVCVIPLLGTLAAYLPWAALWAAIVFVNVYLMGSAGGRHTMRGHMAVVESQRDEAMRLCGELVTQRDAMARLAGAPFSGQPGGDA